MCFVSFCVFVFNLFFLGFFGGGFLLLLFCTQNNLEDNLREMSVAVNAEKNKKNYHQFQNVV